MDQKKRHQKNIIDIAKGAFILFLGYALGNVFELFSKFSLTRILGVEGYGQFSLGLVILGIGTIIATFGLNEGVVRFVSHYNKSKQSSHIKSSILAALKTAIILGSTISVAIILFANQLSTLLFADQTKTTLIILCAIAIPINAAFLIIVAALLGFKKTTYRLFSISIARDGLFFISTLAILLLSTTAYSNINSIAAVKALSLLAGLIVGGILLFKTFPQIRTTIQSQSTFKELLHFSAPLFLSGVFLSTMGHIDTIMIRSFTSITDVGVYSAVLPIAEGMRIFLFAFSGIFLPIATELVYEKDQKYIQDAYSSVSRWIFLATIPILLLIIIFPKTILHLLFGSSSFKQGSLALIILALGQATNFITGPSNQILKALKKTSILLKLNIFLFVANIVLNLLFIKMWGIAGAALSTAGIVSLRQIILYTYTKRFTQISIPLKEYTKYFCAAAVPIIATKIIHNYFIKEHTIYILILYSIIIATGYIALVILFKGLHKEDINMLLKIEQKLGINLNPIKEILKKII